MNMYGLDLTDRALFLAAEWHDAGREITAETLRALVVEIRTARDLRRDAERYQWLRERTHGESDARGRQEFCMPDPHPQGNIMRGSVAQHLDAAIDAEIKLMAETKAAVG